MKKPTFPSFLPASQRRAPASPNGPAAEGKSPPAASRFQSLDLLATLVAVVDAQGGVLYANAALEDALGMSRRSITGALLQDCFTEPALLENALQGASGNQFAALRYDAWLKRLNHDALPVHVVVAQPLRTGCEDCQPPARGAGG